ncbi:isopenicillin N synthase family oxygenase [Leptolyngbya sp. GB1-A1]|uniref:isopenicillin N synthase family dioxygenase n=1 Tax=Leptolyngbya sp. GB1-A1 TaxID=2933908 RepID=UPI0032971193
MRAIETGNGIRQVLTESITAKQIPFDTIPLIDFALMSSDRVADRQQVANQICQACLEVGFFYIKNHGVPQSVINHAFAQSKRFFSLPLAEKMEIHISNSSNHRGYVPFLEERVDVTAEPDLKEALDFSLNLPADDPDVLAGKWLYGPNVYPAQLCGFQEAIERYYSELRQLGTRIFRAFALALDLPETFFNDKTTKPLAQLRLSHYPPCTGVIHERQISLGAHTDYECFTILAQEDVEGLQVLNSAGEWIAAPPIPGTFVINIGDQMARWTNNRFQSNIHRALNRSNRDRYVTTLFFAPNYDTVIEVFPSCTSPENPARYAPITAGDFISSIYHKTFSYLQ